MAPPVFVSASPVITSRSATIAVRTPDLVRVDDVLLCFLWSGDAATGSNLDATKLPAGWTVLSDLTVGGQRSVLLRRLVDAREPAVHEFVVTPNPVGLPLAASCLAYRGIDPHAALLAASMTANAVGAPTVSFACPTQTLPEYLDLYLGFAAGHNAAVTCTPPAGTVERLDDGDSTSGSAFISAFSLLPGVAGATGAKTITLSVADYGAQVSYLLHVLPPADAPR